jgi:phospholipid/cholesterol/gamma-HCH transport system ATP-binding protein
MEKQSAPIDHNNAVIRVHGLKKSFGDYPVLRGVDLELYQGENLVVLGRSGTGKSVLIKIISGLLQADSGTVEVLGNDIAHLNTRELRELRIRIGFSFQNSALYDSMTVRKNLEFPLVRNKPNITKPEIDKAVESVLDAVGLSQTINQMPSELSGGQRKRIGIARTLILNCIEINDLINEVQQNYKTSSIIITHDLTCAKQTGDRVAMLLDGQFQREGSFDQVFDTNDARVKPFFDYNFIK